MSVPSGDSNEPHSRSTAPSPRGGSPTFATGGIDFHRACPACGGPLLEIRAKLQCQRCHWIIETCCEGGRQ